LGRPPGIFNLPLALIRSAVRLAGLSAAWERLAGDLIADADRLERTGWRPAEPAAEGLARWMRESAAQP
jgi:hypothetical protein